MTRTSLWFVVVILVTSLILSGPSALAQNQQPAASTVSSVGAVTLKHQPTILRATTELSAQAPELTEAIEKLAAEREAARSRLIAMGAKEDSIQIGQTVIGSAAAIDPRMRQYQQMMQAARGGRRTATTQPATVMVSASVQAEWELKAVSPDELLVVGDELQKKIKEGFAVATRTLTPEEQELMEEMRGSGMATEQNPGEAKFVYVHKLSDDEYRKALADAFAKAYADAQPLASAAGARLGPVRQIAVITVPGARDENPMQMFYYAAQQGGRGADATADREATGSQPGNVSLSITVTTAFELQYQ